MFICTTSEDGDFYRMASQTAKLIEQFVIEMKMPTIVTLDDCPPRAGWIGQYTSSDNKIKIDRNYWYKNKTEEGIKKVIHTLCHEIGHSVHFVYLANKAQYLERAHRGSRSYHCNLNSRESFAECFADYCFAVFENDTEKIAKSKRLCKMERILKGIIGGGYEVAVISDCGLYMLKNWSLARYRNINYTDTIVEGKNKLINPFTDKLKQGAYENLINSRIDEIGLSEVCTDACKRAGYLYVRDFATKEAIENINIRIIGKKNLNTVLSTLRRCGIEGI